MNITQENFLLNRKAFYLKELSELKDKEYVLKLYISQIDAKIKKEEEKESKNKLEIDSLGNKSTPYSDGMFSVHNYYGGIDPIHMGSKGEEDIVKRDKEYLENVEKISKYFNGCILQEEQEVKNEEDPNPIHKIELDKDTTISFRLINPDLSSEEGLEEIGKAKEFFRKLLGSYYSTYTSEDPEPFSAPSGSDFDVDKESIKKEEKIQEQIRKEENEKDNKLLSILERLTKAFEEYLKKIK